MVKKENASKNTPHGTRGPVRIDKSGKIKKARINRRKAIFQGSGMKLGGSGDTVSGMSRLLLGNPSTSTQVTEQKATTPSKGPPVRIDKSGNIKPTPPRRKRIVMKGNGMKLGDNDVVEHSTFALGKSGSGTETAMHRIGAELAAAARGGNASEMQTSVLKSLRTSFKEARKQRGAEAEAQMKYAASIGGRVRFEEIGDNSGRIRVIYSASARTEKEECIPDFPVFLLAAVLRQLASDTDPTAIANLRPENMALVSPRVFWSVVRHGEVGIGCSFIMGLLKIVPEVNWYAIDQRLRAKPERYADYVNSENIPDPE